MFHVSKTSHIFGLWYTSLMIHSAAKDIIKKSRKKSKKAVAKQATLAEPKVTHYSLTLGDRGRLVLPAKLRKQLELEQGDRLLVTLEADGTVKLLSSKKVIENARGMFSHLAEPGRSAVDDFIAQRRAEAARE